MVGSDEPKFGRILNLAQGHEEGRSCFVTPQQWETIRQHRFIVLDDPKMVCPGMQIQPGLWISGIDSKQIKFMPQDRHHLSRVVPYTNNLLNNIPYTVRYAGPAWSYLAAMVPAAFHCRHPAAPPELMVSQKIFQTQPHMLVDTILQVIENEGYKAAIYFTQIGAEVEITELLNYKDPVLYLQPWTVYKVEANDYTRQMVLKMPSAEKEGQLYFYSARGQDKVAFNIKDDLQRVKGLIHFVETIGEKTVSIWNNRAYIKRGEQVVGIMAWTGKWPALQHLLQVYWPSQGSATLMKPLLDEMEWEEQYKTKKKMILTMDYNCKRQWKQFVFGLG